MTDTAAGRWRFELVFGLGMLALVALSVWMAVLIHRGRPKALELLLRQQRMRIPLPGRRGNIFARARSNYVLLAGSRQVPSCYADPFLLRDGDLDDVALAVGSALQIDPKAVQEKLVARRKARFVYLARDISQAKADAVRALKLRAVRITHEWRREYPNGDLAATVVGFFRRDGVAGGGLELSMQRHLVATDGVRVVLGDAGRRGIWPLPDLSRPPADGSNVYLCLDAVIQGYLHEAIRESVEHFEARWGTGVVVDPRTGEVLAMASAPTFDPNRFPQAPAGSRSNRAICVPYEPGSVVKPLFASAAVDAGVAGFDTRIFCENGLYLARRGGRISDHGKHYGYLSLTDVVVYSSNIGMAKVGEILGNKRINEIAGRFGFGEKTFVQLGGESKGIVRQLEKWDGYSLRRVPFGQEISTTAIQVAMAFCSLANGGLLLRPRLVDYVTDAGGAVVWRGRREVVRRVLSPAVAAQALGVLTEVVRRGTGKACAMERWSSFGKTGTAQIAGVGGYVEDAYVGTFLGGAPADVPRVLCLISIYWPTKSRGYYGSAVAAPYVKDVLARTLAYLDVPPDRPAETAPAVLSSFSRRR